MGYLLELIASFTDHDGSRLIFVVLVAGAVFALGLSGAYVVSAFTNPLNRRLSGLEKPAEWEVKDLSTGKSMDKKNDTHSDQYLSKLSKFVLPHNDEETSKIQLQMIRSGIRSDTAIKTFFALKTIAMLLFGFIIMMITRWFPELSSTQILLYVCSAAFVGFLAPNMFLDRMEIRRIRCIRNAFPDALDLFVVCVEAGLGLDVTIQRVGKEMEVSHPELSGELILVSSEIRMGVGRIDALRGMAIRTGLDEIRGLVALIDQSVRFGTGIAETLRVYSEDFRDRRTQQAEEEAAKIGTKLIFPLTFCIWPAFFLVAIGPAILGIMEVFE